MAKGARFIDGDDGPGDDLTDHDAPSAADMARFGSRADDDDEQWSDHDDEAFDDQPERWDGVGMAPWKKALVVGGVILAFAGALALTI